MKQITTLMLALLMCACQPKQAVKHHATIIDEITVETGLLRKKKNVAYTVIELEDSSRHRIAGDWGSKGDSRHRVGGRRTSGNKTL